jgi:hypothetical protein
VEVTEADIAAGKPLKNVYCPVARAIRRAVPLACVSVSYRKLGFRRRAGDEAVFIDTPDDVRRLIHGYDATRRMPPFGFTIDVPDPAAG